MSAKQDENRKIFVIFDLHVSRKFLFLPLMAVEKIIDSHANQRNVDILSDFLLATENLNKYINILTENHTIGTEVTLLAYSSRITLSSCKKHSRKYAAFHWLIYRDRKFDNQNLHNVTYNLTCTSAGVPSSSWSNKVFELYRKTPLVRAVALFKKRLRNRYFPVNFWEIFRSSYFQSSAR